MNAQHVLAKIKETILADSPSSQLILFGSRSRGDAQYSSDWDILILIDDKLTDFEKIGIHKKLFDVELETGEVINAIIHTRHEWNTPLFQAMPIHQSIVREGNLV